MASAALDGSGQPHQDLEASVSSKLFNSGRPLGSFLDIGNTSDSSVRPPIDTDDGDSAALSRGVSAATIAKSVSSCSADARTPRAVQGVQKTNVEATTDIQYPPVLSSMSRSSLVPSTHPQLLPHQANLDPSSSGAVSYNSSGQSSFDNSNARQDRLAVSHPGILNSSSLDRAYPNAMNAGLKGRSELGEYGSSNGVNGDTPKNGSFDKISGGKQNMQIFGTPPVGIIGVHQPREIIRLDRDYSSGEICQFWSGFPLELEGRVSGLHTASQTSDIQ